MRQTKVSFWSQKARAKRGRGEEGRKEEEEGGEEEEDQKGMFSSWDQVYFGFLGFWFGELFLLCLGFWKRSPKPKIFVGVMRVKPQLVENKHGIIMFIWFLEELVDLRLSSWILT